MIVTVAPGMTSPWASFTVPRIVPVMPCARASGGAARTTAPTTTARTNRSRWGTTIDTSGGVKRDSARHHASTGSGGPQRCNRSGTVTSRALAPASAGSARRQLVEAGQILASGRVARIELQRAPQMPRRLIAPPGLGQGAAEIGVDRGGIGRQIRRAAQVCDRRGPLPGGEPQHAEMLVGFAKIRIERQRATVFLQRVGFATSRREHLAEIEM